jgi:hypothetical protein
MKDYAIMSYGWYYSVRAFDYWAGISSGMHQV